MLEISELRKAYGGRQVLDGVDLTVDKGQIVGLLGANGAGKTTLISIVAGLRRADSGRALVAGVDALRQPHKAARHLGLAPQGLGLYPTLTVADNLAFFARLAGVRKVRARVAEIAERLELTAQLGQRAAVLSGGQQRRLHTGMAVLHEPDLLFLDEPTVGADVRSRAGILELVRDLAARGTAIVYTTHYLTELEQLGADIAVLHGGRIVAEGPVEQVVKRYAKASVTLRFARTPEERPGWRRDGVCLSKTADDPGAEAARVLGSLDAGVLSGVEIAPANLETAFLAITGETDTGQTSTGETNA